MVEELAPLPVGPVRRVAFLGTPELAVPVLRALVDAKIDVGHVVTRVDKRRARGNDLYPSPVNSDGELACVVIAEMARCCSYRAGIVGR